jgi:hypothetical protein
MTKHDKSIPALVSIHRQRGSVFLGYALIAFVLCIAGAILIPVHQVFALLIPVGVLVFFTPNLMALYGWLNAGRRMRERLAARRGANPNVVVLKNEFGGFNAQAVWFAPSSRQLGLISENDDGSVRSWDALVRIRAVYAEETYAVSFHQGKIRIPARYVLVFEFTDARPIELVTRKRRLIDEWIATVQERGPGKVETDKMLTQPVKG